jgi:aerobic-type carbon monoxide dehydrogenase small subunit (CoxS/CutS family)
MASIRINGQDVNVSAADDKPLLWVLRDDAGLKGTKYSCGAGLCGACTVLVNGRPVRSCIFPVAEVGDAEVTTIEGLARNPQHPVVQAWIDERVPQCGYCQPGQIMTAAALLQQNPSPSEADIDAAMSGVLCRCGTYLRIRRAIHRAAQSLRAQAIHPGAERHG